MNENDHLWEDSRLHQAYFFAKDAHAGQLDDDGYDYITHPVQVWRLVRVVASTDIKLQQAALLHDTIEDTDATYEDLEEQFGKEVADLVMEVTHEGKKDNYGFYFPRLKTKRGILLKFADRMSNLSRMDTWSEERKEHYLKKSKFWKSEGPKKKKSGEDVDG